MIIVWDSYNKATGWQAYDAVTAYLAFHAGEGGTAPVVPVTTTVPGGVRRARFLRRAPRLPWEDIPEEKQDQEVVIAKPIRRKVKLPPKVIEAAKEALPVAEYVEISAPKITIPEIGTAVLKIPDDEEEAVLMALLQ